MPSNPLIKLVNVPDPVPLSVLPSVTFGSPEVLQHTPRDVTGAPPSLLTVPPDLEEVDVMEETISVAIVGISGLVLKLTWLPYCVPALFVAYART